MHNNRSHRMRPLVSVLTVLLLQSPLCFGDGVQPRLLEGARTDIPNDIPLPDLLARRWAEHDQVYVSKGPYPEPSRYVTSCVELDAAFANGEYAMDTASMGKETQRREDCQNIKRLLRATPASRSDIVWPFCLDRDAYLKLSETLDGLWGASGLESVVVTSCKPSDTAAIVKYRQLIEPANEWHEGLFSARVGLRYLVQGDFDGDGWLDVIAELTAGLEFPAGVWYQSGMSAVVKLSRVDGDLKVATFSDL